MNKIEIIYFVCLLLFQMELVFLYVKIHKVENLIKKTEEEVLTWTTKLVEFFDKQDQEVEFDLLKFLTGQDTDNPYQE